MNEVDTSRRAFFADYSTASAAVVLPNEKRKSRLANHALRDLVVSDPFLPCWRLRRHDERRSRFASLKCKHSVRQVYQGSFYGINGLVVFVLDVPLKREP